MQKTLQMMRNEQLYIHSRMYQGTVEIIASNHQKSALIIPILWVSQYSIVWSL